MSLIVSRLLAALLILVGSATLFMGAKSLLNAKHSNMWPVTQGKVVSSKVGTKSGDNGTTYHAEVLYEFNVSGQIHTSNRVSYGDYGASDPSHARGVVNKYPAGATVSVFHSPQHPDSCVLEPGISGQTFFLPVFGGVFCAVGFAMLIIIPRSLEKQKAVRGARKAPNR